MTPILAAILSTYLLILLGVALKSREVVGAEFWQAMQKLNYHVFLPVLFAYSFATSEVFAEVGMIGFVVAIIGTLVAGAAITLIWVRRNDTRPDLELPLVEGAIRSNVPLGSTMAFTLLGSTGLTLFLGAAATYLISVILIGAFVVNRSGLSEVEETEGAFAAAIRLIARNPIVGGAVVGIVLNVTGIGIADGLSSILQIVGMAALPIGVLATGAHLDLRAAQSAIEIFRANVTADLIIKLAILPVIATVFTFIFGVDGSARVIIILLAATPAVAPRFTLARDSETWADLPQGLAAAGTVAGLVTLPLVLWILV
jgi:predicted permease